MKAPRYKVVETMVVTDEELERLINETVAEGWLFDGMHFAMTEASKRPAMAFLMFTCRPALASRNEARNEAP
jgi:hypothetical protein